MSDVVEKILSWAVPSEADDAVWQGMTRDQQLVALQDLADHPDTNTPSDATVSEIVERTRQRRAKQGTDGYKL